MTMDSQDYVGMTKPLELDNVTWLCKNNIQHGWNNYAIEIFKLSKLFIIVCHVLFCTPLSFVHAFVRLHHVRFNIKPHCV
jgi:hypothetical protein